MRILTTFLLASIIGLVVPAAAQNFRLDTTGYFRSEGVDVMAFDDIYPEGHQGGVSVIMHGNRLLTNGDIRLEPTPGQWQPLPKQLRRVADIASNTITAYMAYPDSSKHVTGFNPMIYPKLELNYTVKIRGEGKSVVVTVDLDRPIPQEYLGKVGFNLELFPGAMFDKPWIMDSQSGIFPRQPNAPTESAKPNHTHIGDYNPKGKADANKLIGSGFSPIVADDVVAAPYSEGRKLTVLPDDPYSKITIESATGNLKLYDGRMNHNNGWFVVRTEIPAGATREAIRWTITPNVVADWMYQPVIQISQVGYHPRQPKTAVIELDGRDSNVADATLYKITENGVSPVKNSKPVKWGKFLRYNYVKFDFTDIQEEGLYKIKYGSSESNVFRIARDVYDRGVWQPVLEYFLPVQMCHIRVNEKYRVWHDSCHTDDARMAPVNFNHIDGYVQGPSTLTKYQPGDIVPGLNIGGWHDAGDYDLRVESQAGESYILALAYEAFGVDYDETAIDQLSRIVEIHQPDGKADILQQVENGALSVVGAYRSLGRLYRGIIERDLRQYVSLGDAAAITDRKIGNDDDRWVFTEENPARELTTAAELAAVSRVMKGFNDTLSNQSLQAAKELYEITQVNNFSRSAKIHAAAELYLTTKDAKYKEYVLAQTEYIRNNIERVGWYLGRFDREINDKKFSAEMLAGLEKYKEKIVQQTNETPYGIPYRPRIWGAGWDIQSLGYNLYFLHKSYPQLFPQEYVFNALNFILGCHPGSNTASFASGVGVKSAIPGYGLNRADWSYIPGGVVSGTALIRPDFPELLTFPYLWQQVEYVLGGGSSHYMFLVLAAKQILEN